jgi:iron complex outermembrane receptor protein
MAALRTRTSLRDHGRRYLAACLVLAAAPGWGAGPEPRAQDLTDLSLEELLNVEVTSVGRREQPLADSAAALFVLTQDDIRRSGAASIPDVLRLVPGLHVARIDANKWVISSRGFSGRFANKLLVLVDGRSVYSPLSSGVYWDALDILPADVDRIEVIRGAGASVWGANAVSGVINVITKRPSETQGTSVEALGGGTVNGLASLRHGGRLGEGGWYRVYGKYSGHDDLARPSGRDAADGWDATRGGFRAEWALDGRTDLTLQGEAYREDGGQTLVLPSLSAPLARVRQDGLRASGSHLLSRWSRRRPGSGSVAVQVYADAYDRAEGAIRERLLTYDFDYEQRSAAGGRHDLVWGAGHRVTDDRLADTDVASYDPVEFESGLSSAFFQDVLRTKGGRSEITLGTKIEHSEVSGYEIQPGVRALLRLGDRQAVWAAVTRATRTSSRAERDVRSMFTVTPTPLGIPAALTVLGNADQGSENVRAHEVGYRARAGEKVSVDVAAFLNLYDDLASAEQGRPRPGTIAPPHLVVPMNFCNCMYGTARGFEASANWKALSRWSLSGWYSWLGLEIEPRAGHDGAEAFLPSRHSPERQVQVRSLLDLPGGFSFDLSLHWTDRLREADSATAQGSPGGRAVPSYTRLDARLAWRPVPDLEASLGVQDALDGRHLEFRPTDVVRPSEAERSWYARLQWRF